MTKTALDNLFSALIVLIILFGILFFYPIRVWFISSYLESQYNTKVECIQGHTYKFSAQIEECHDMHNQYPGINKTAHALEDIGYGIFFVLIISFLVTLHYQKKNPGIY